MNLNQLMKQAQEMQAKMQKAQQEIANLIVVGEAGAGLVKIEMTGRYDAKRVHIDSSLMQEEKEMLEDLIAAAINDAVRKIEKTSRDRMSGLTAGMQLPEGMKFPFGDEGK
jgi:nucleoid-associated protein EbfC